LQQRRIEVGSSITACLPIRLSGEAEGVMVDRRGGADEQRVIFRELGVILRSISST
jgi:hypothetical protein